MKTKTKMKVKVKCVLNIVGNVVLPGDVKFELCHESRSRAACNVIAPM